MYSTLVYHILYRPDFFLYLPTLPQRQDIFVLFLSLLSSVHLLHLSSHSVDLQTPSTSHQKRPRKGCTQMQTRSFWFRFLRIVSLPDRTASLCSGLVSYYDPYSSSCASALHTLWHANSQSRGAEEVWRRLFLGKRHVESLRAVSLFRRTGCPFEKCGQDTDIPLREMDEMRIRYDGATTCHRTYP